MGRLPFILLFMVLASLSISSKCTKNKLICINKVYNFVHFVENKKSSKKCVPFEGEKGHIYGNNKFNLDYFLKLNISNEGEVGISF